jgi:hypothetical protein
LATHAAVSPQSWHAPPPEPHASPAPPPEHALSAQQPAHVAGPQVAATTQLPAVQTSDIGHGTHDAPPPPHADGLVPAWQSPFVSQQPGQFSALHPVATQRPPLFGPAGAHSEPVHASQAAPPVPQASRLVPTLQTPLEQHPAQLSGPQPVEHCPPPGDAGMHVAPFTQLPQAAPRVPQNELDVPTSQTSPLQQPTQAPQGEGGMQSPLESHVYPAGQEHGGATWQTPPPSPGAQTAGVPELAQSTHELPPAPQVSSAVPGWQTPFAQHPSHEPGPQGPASSGPPSGPTIVVSPAKSDERPHPPIARSAVARTNQKASLVIGCSREHSQKRDFARQRSDGSDADSFAQSAG